MVERMDTNVTRHAGGWIVLGGGLLVVCLCSAASRRISSGASGKSLLPTLSDPRSGNAVADDYITDSSGTFPRLHIDINEASEAELSCVAGVGPALARRIVDYRRNLGRIDSLDELEKIPGVGPHLLAQLTGAIGPMPKSWALPTEYQTHPAAPTAPVSPQPERAHRALPDPSRTEGSILVGQHF